VKEDLIALLEALRLVRAEVDRPIRFANPSETLDRIEEIIGDREVEMALRRLDPDGQTADAPDGLPARRANASTPSMRSH
jgi:hypothetical protein